MVSVITRMLSCPRLMILSKCTDIYLEGPGILQNIRASSLEIHRLALTRAFSQVSAVGLITNPILSLSFKFHI